MRCPYCQTENRDDRERCYACEKDISMLRLIINKAKHHYNLALEHAERGRNLEAIDELRNAIDLNREFVSAHVVLGTLYAKRNEFGKAREAWTTALALQPDLQKAHNYLERADAVQRAVPALRRARIMVLVLVALALACVAALLWALRPDPGARHLQAATRAHEAHNFKDMFTHLDRARQSAKPGSTSRASADALEAAVLNHFRQETTLAQEEMLHGEFERALGRLRELETQELDPVTRVAVDLVKQRLEHELENELQDLDELYRDGRTSYDEYADAAARLVALAPERRQDRLQRMVAARPTEEMPEAPEPRLTREEVVESFNATLDLETLRANMNELVGEGDDEADVAAGVVEEALAALFYEFDSKLGMQELEQSRAAFDKIEQLSQWPENRLDISGPLKLAGEILEREQLARRLRFIDELVTSGSLEEAQQELTLVATDLSTTVNAGLIERLESRIRDAHTSVALAKFRQQRSRFASLNISDDDASSTLQVYDDVLSGLDESSRTERLLVLQAAAASAIKLKNAELSEELLDRMREEKADTELIRKLNSQMKRIRR